MNGNLLVMAGALSVFGLLKWYIADLDHSRKWSVKQAELGAQGRWKELNDHYEAGLKCRRPLLRLFRLLKNPGLMEAQYALHLSNQGEHDKALLLADQAVRRCGRRRINLDQTLIVRAHILYRMGRYEEAKHQIARARASGASPASADLGEGIIELNLGHIDAALALGRGAIDDPKALDPARALVSGALCLKGRFQEAVNILSYQSANVLAYFSPETLEQVTSDQIGESLVLAMDEELAGVFRPGRHLAAAEVCLEAGDTENLGKALDRVERELKSHPGVEHIYRRLRACYCAAKNDPPGAEESTQRARQLAEEYPSRSGRFETHRAAGRAYFMLGHHETALSELNAALQFALHPLEKHVTNYWLARCAQAAGQAVEATRAFNLVEADRFETWMSKDAVARVKSLPGEIGPDATALVIGE